jgi:secreted trypsin-like serine protease
VKRTLTTTVQKVKSDVVLIGQSGKQACSGDSGGPAILTMNGVDTLIAIDDYGDKKIDCTGGDYYRRVDTELDFIQPFVASAGGSAPLAGPVAALPSAADGTTAPSDPSAPDDAKKTATAHAAAAAPGVSSCSAAGTATTGSGASSGWAWLAVLGLVLTRARRGGRGGRAASPT